MADQDIKQTVLKLEALKTSICELFAKDNSDYFAVIEKLEQMEHLVADLPNVIELTVFWQQKLISFWKSLSAEGLNVVELQSFDRKYDNLLPVASETPVELSPKTVEVDSLQETYSHLTIHSPSKEVNTKNEPLNIPKRHSVSKQSLQFITNYIKKNPQESLKKDVYQLSTTSKEEDETIKKTKDDLACLSSIAGPSDVEAIKKLHLFTEKVRNGEPSAMYTQQSASIFAAAFEKLSLDQKEFYSQLNYTKDATKNNYRCWSNLSAFLKQQLVSYFTKELLMSTRYPDAEYRTCNYCNYCKKDGHNLVQCPFRRANVCFICFNYGHSQVYCDRFGVSC